MNCYCGHTEDEHGGDPQYPGVVCVQRRRLRL